jgi:hypothetical protein
MISSPAELEAQECEARIAKLKSDRDAALATPGQEKRAADLNDGLIREERLLESLQWLASPKKPLGDAETQELNGDCPFPSRD